MHGKAVSSALPATTVHAERTLSVSSVRLSPSTPILKVSNSAMNLTLKWPQTRGSGGIAQKLPFYFDVISLLPGCMLIY